MRRFDSFWPGFLALALTAIFVLPPLIFAVCLVQAGVGFSETATHLAEHYQSERPNLAVAGLPALVPFALLGLILGLVRWLRGKEGSTALLLGGGLPIVLILVWANATVWPLHLPGRSYPGWPHGLELVIAPLFFAPVAMLVGLVMAWFWRRAG